VIVQIVFSPSKILDFAQSKQTVSLASLHGPFQNLQICLIVFVAARINQTLSDLGGLQTEMLVQIKWKFKVLLPLPHFASRLNYSSEVSGFQAFRSLHQHLEHVSILCCIELPELCERPFSVTFFQQVIDLGHVETTCF